LLCIVKWGFSTVLYILSTWYQRHELQKRNEEIFLVT
jgi:hypothetical protein